MSSSATSFGDRGGYGNLGGGLLAAEADLALVERHRRLGCGLLLGVVVGGDSLGDDVLLRLACLDVRVLRDDILLELLRSRLTSSTAGVSHVVARIRHTVGALGLSVGPVTRDGLDGGRLLATEADLTLEEGNALG